MDMERPKITHVIFDMDGLILDTETRYAKAYETLLGRYGKEYTLESKMKIMGRTGKESSKILINDLQLPMTPDEFDEKIHAEYRKVFEDPVAVLPGAERLIRHLHCQKIPIAVATSSRSFAFEMKTKHHQELFRLFDHILLASEDPEVQKGKPDPQTFLVAAQRFKTPPETPKNCIVFEDSANGVLAANSAGMISIWVPDPIMPKDMVKPYQILNSLEEFKPEEFGLPPFK